MTSKKNLSILFGAGAEVDLGMPTGGEFAIEVISSTRDLDIWNSIKEQIESVQNVLEEKGREHGWEQYREWLFDVVDSKITLTRPVKQELETIFRSTIEENQERIGKIISSIDERMLRLGFADLDLENVQIQSLDIQLSNDILGHFARLNDSKCLGKLIGYAVTHLDRKEEIETIWCLVRMFVEFAYAATGRDLVKRLGVMRFGNDKIGEKVGTNLTNIINIDFGKLGMEAIEFSVKHPKSKLDADFTEKISLFSAKLIREVVTQVIDYQEIIEKYLPALYRPRAKGSAKFLKALMMINRMNATILEYYHEATKSDLRNSYYHDLLNLFAEYTVTIASTNYTDLVCDIADIDSHKVIWLNGHVGQSLEPYQNRLYDSKFLPEGLITAPYLIAQSVIKPMLTPESIVTYRDFGNALAKSDRIIVIGYGFGAVDSHVNSLVRNAILSDLGPAVTIFIHESELESEKPSESEQRARNLVLSRLRLFKDPGENLVVHVIGSNRNSSGKSWLEYI